VLAARPAAMHQFPLGRAKGSQAEMLGLPRAGTGTLYTCSALPGLVTEGGRLPIPPDKRIPNEPVKEQIRIALEAA